MVDWEKLNELGDWLKSQDARIEKVTFHSEDDWDSDTDKVWIRIRGKTPEVPGRTFQFDYLIPPSILDAVDWHMAFLDHFRREVAELIKKTLTD